MARLVRQIAAEAGTSRLAVRARPTSDLNRIVVAYPWRHQNRAEALGRAVSQVLDGLANGDIDTLVEHAADEVRQAKRGDHPPTVRPTIRVVAVTGTNGKTTTSRMIAHIGRCAGLHVGWSSTDGVYIDGELVEEGDYSGPSGAGRVLGTSRGRAGRHRDGERRDPVAGVGVTHNDVSVVTNISADHLGLQGIDTLDQLAEVKAVITRITRSDGWCVVNGDDPRTLAMRLDSPARPWVFCREQDAPAVRQVLNEGGRATTLIDGWISVIERRAIPTRWCRWSTSP